MTARCRGRGARPLTSVIFAVCSTAARRPTHGAFALALGGVLCDKVDHGETSEADSRAIDRVEPIDAAGDRRAAGERPPAGRGNAGDPGGTETADGSGVEGITDTDHRRIDGSFCEGLRMPAP